MWKFLGSWADPLKRSDFFLVNENWFNFHRATRNQSFDLRTRGTEIWGKAELTHILFLPSKSYLLQQSAAWFFPSEGNSKDCEVVRMVSWYMKLYWSLYSLSCRNNLGCLIRHWSISCIISQTSINSYELKNLRSTVWNSSSSLTSN